MAAIKNGTGASDIENLYHVLLGATHDRKDPNGAIEKLRVCATFTDLKAAKAEAHKTLFEAGYEREWFTEYDTNEVDFTTHHVFLGSPVDHKVHFGLYHVVETVISYDEDDSGEARESNVEGSFEIYEDARKFAGEVLLVPEDGVTKGSFAQYDEAGRTEKDCGYGENVVVHAVGGDGENFLVSVLKGQELEAMRPAEAAIRIRSSD